MWHWRYPLEKSVSTTVRHFIVENFLYGDHAAPLEADDSFLEKGIVDSTGILELVAYLEREFGIQVHDQEIIPDNFDSIGKLTRYVEQKQNGVAHAS